MFIFLVLIDLMRSGSFLNLLIMNKIMKWIVADIEICHGKPTFKESRILVSDVLELIASGESFESVIQEYPTLTEDMIKEALIYSEKVI